MSQMLPSRDRTLMLMTLLALGALPAACDESSSSDTGSVALDDAGMPVATPGAAPLPPPPPPVPALAFAFDEKAGRLRARVRLDTPRDAMIYARVRRAEAGTSAPVDCTALRRAADATPLDGAKMANGVLEVTGPRVPSALLETTYGRDGKSAPSRSVIDACLFDARGAELAKVSTSLMKAWDDAIAIAPDSDSARRPLHGVQAYARACEADLGELPMFRGGSTLDCAGGSEMHVVPITVSDPARPDTVVMTLDGATTTWPLRPDQVAATRRCDKPAWLDYSGSANSQCSPFSRVGAFANTKGTRVVVACRRTAARARDNATFDDVNMIAHNPISGHTCFFNSRIETSLRADAIPSPTSDAADAFWMDIRDVSTAHCTNCHDADPWIHTPWIDQLHGPDGHVLIPRIGEDSAYTIKTKYSVFARESFVARSRNGDFATWEQPQHLASAGKCGSCHRIGSKAGAGSWTPRSVGHPFAADWFREWVTPAYRTAAKLHWMSPGGAPDAQDDGDSVDGILACADGGRGCVVEDTPH
jgi:hypothetical protein